MTNCYVELSQCRQLQPAGAQTIHPEKWQSGIKWASMSCFLLFCSKARCRPQNKASLITEFLIKSELPPPRYNFFFPQAMLCPNRYIWFSSDQWICPSLKPTVSSDIMNDSLMYNQAIMKGWWFSMNRNTLHKPTLIVSYKPQFVSCLQENFIRTHKRNCVNHSYYQALIHFGVRITREPGGVWLILKRHENVICEILFKLYWQYAVFALHFYFSVSSSSWIMRKIRLLLMYDSCMRVIQASLLVRDPGIWCLNCTNELLCSSVCER